ncbi:MAG TPA: FAD-dependent oxidoreductase [Mucilaginibacter sp.]
MKIAVIGNGVIGLTTAIKLQEEGREVVIYSKDPDRLDLLSTVSLVACALWQPYKLFKNLDEVTEAEFADVKKVSLESLKQLNKIYLSVGSAKSGIYIKKHFEYSSDSIYKENTRILKKDFYYIDVLRDFWKDEGFFDTVADEIELEVDVPFKSIDQNSIEHNFRYLHGYQTFAIDPGVFLKYLTDVFLKMGGEILKKELNLNEIKKLKERIIFNCTGKNGLSLINKNASLIAHRKMSPKKGVLLLYKLKDDHQFENTIVLDELTILCRQNELTIGTGEVKLGESPQILIDRLIKHTIEFISARNINRFGLDDFINYHSIDLFKPDVILVGERPYLSDGKGYVLNQEEFNSKFFRFSVYNNFGHGGSGVTLSCGCANKITDLYLLKVKDRLNSYNENRRKLNVSDVSIELGHFDLKDIKKLSDEELNELLAKEKGRVVDVIQQFSRQNKTYSIVALIDDKKSYRRYDTTIKKFKKGLSKVGVDFIAYESGLINYLDKLQGMLPNNIAKEFYRKMQNHHKLACSQDIFLWYCLRFGIIDFSFDDEVIEAISENAKNGIVGFSSNALISCLNIFLNAYEEKADEFLSKAFGDEVASSVKRIYYSPTR